MQLYKQNGKREIREGEQLDLSKDSDYTVEVRNRFKGLDLIECLMNYGQRFLRLYRRQGARRYALSTENPVCLERLEKDVLGLMEWSS